MKSLTQHEMRILDLVQRHPEIVSNKAARERIASEIGITEKTLRNRIADLKRYGFIDSLTPTSGARIYGTLVSDQKSDLLIYIQVLLKKWKLIFANFIGVALLAIGVSLIMPKTFRSTSVIMPPTTQQDLGLLGAITDLPFSGFNFGVSDTESMTFLAILKSRTVMENAIKEFNLVELWDVENMEEAVERLRKNTIFEIEDEGTISISVDISTGWFSGEVEDEKAKQLCTNIGNYFVSNLDLVNKNLKTEQARFQREFIEERYYQNIRDIKDTEERLKAFQEEHNMIALPEQTQAAIGAAATIKAQIIADEVRLNVLTEAYSANHPDVEMIRKEIMELESQLNAMEVGSTKDNLFPGFSDVPELAIQLVRLERDLEIQNTLFVFLTQQYEEAKIQEARDTPTVQVLDRAVKPEKKHKPKRAIFVLFGSFLSFLFTSIYVLFRPALVVLYNDLKK